MPSDVNLMTAYMHEFNALKAEVLARSSAQHTLINLDVTISSTVIGFAIANNANLLVLLLVPLVSTSMGFLYLDHHTSVQRIGTYINEQIRPSVQRLIDNEAAWTWENFFNNNFWNRRSSQVVFWFPLVVLFILAPLFTTVYTANLSKSPVLWVTWGLGVVTEISLLGLGSFMFSQAWIRGYGMDNEPSSNEDTPAV